jgi:GT2 family glycosyltransferase
MNTHWTARRAMTAPYQAFRQTLRVVIPLAWRRFLVRLVRGEQLSPEEMYWAKATRIITPLSLAGPARYDVICFPVIDWDFRFQRPQQLMIQFAAAGHRVFYLSQHFRRSGPLYLLREKRRNLYEVSLRGLPRSIYTEFLDHQACEALFAALDQMRGEQSLSAAAIVQLPFWWPLVERTRTCFAWPIVYDCMDHHAGFSLNRPEMLRAEERLLSEADSVIVSSLFLEREARKRNHRVVMARNGCDYEHFAQVAPSTSTASGVKRPVIGYYGAIADWFDADLVADLAERRPDWDFVLVGSTQLADLSRLGKAPNIALAGEQPYAKIPEWLDRFDVTIIPFKRTPLTEATNPVKAYEILAAGKPLVSTPLPEVVALGPIVRLASNVEEFEREIAGALAEDDPALIEQRRAFSHENTWEKRFEALAPTVSASFPKASIIIVTYNNLALNRQCLESLYQHTEWPNFEVIVVDNASTDGTAEYLREAERTFPNLRVVLNESDLGFAAANNQGLRLASGEYLALLNNDTAPTRGWLSSLIRHLSADPQIGLIGPAPNEIGNEAKVEAGYESLDELPVWALNYTRRHDGQLFSPPMLDMFCVAMRRSVLEKVGPLDERFGIGMFEDDDYARRLREQGYKLVCARDAFVHHAGSASFKRLSQENYRALFEQSD